MEHRALSILGMCIPEQYLIKKKVGTEFFRTCHVAITLWIKDMSL